MCLAAAGELWFLGLAIDLLTTIQNPFTSHKRNRRVYRVVFNGIALAFALGLLASGNYGRTAFRFCFVSQHVDVGGDALLPRVPAKGFGSYPDPKAGWASALCYVLAGFVVLPWEWGGVGCGSECGGGWGRCVAWWCVVAWRGVEVGCGLRANGQGGICGSEWDKLSL